MEKNQLILLAGCLTLGMQPMHAVAQALDPSFTRTSLYAAGLVYSAFEQTDGKKIVTGSYSRVNGAASAQLVRFNTNGTIDATFQQNVGTTSPVYRVAQTSNGQLLLTSFTTSTFTVSGITRNSIIRLNNDGTPDASFDTGVGTNSSSPGSSVDFTLPLPNGQVLATGGFNSFNGVAVNNIVRLNASGGVDATFNSGSGADDYIGTSALLPTGKILIAGYFTAYNGGGRNGMARLNADGSLDNSFVPNLPALAGVDNFAVQPDGKIVVAGYLDGNTAGLVRLNADGSRDNSFNVPSTIGAGSVYSYYAQGIEIQTDGKLLVAFHDGTSNLPVTRLNANGSIDPTFAPIITGFNFYSMTLLASGKVLVAGRSALLSSTANNALLQLNTNGSLDNSFLPTFQSLGSIANVVRQADGKLIASGNFNEVNGQSVNQLARFNTDGTLDGTYQGAVNVSGAPVDLALQPDGRLLVLNFSSVQRLLATGALDNSFASLALGLNGNNRLLLQSDGRIVVGGRSLGTAAAVVRLLADGTRDNSFSTPVGTGTARMTVVLALAQQADGRLLAAGTYAPATGSTFSTVRRLETNGTFDTSYSPGTILSGTGAGTINSLALQADGKLVLGGIFSTVGGTPASNLARRSTTGMLDAGFTSPTFASGSVSKVLIQPNGRILLGGFFTASGVASNLGRLLNTGAADASYATTAVPNSTVRALLVQPDGGIVAGGQFTTISGQTAGGIARITAPNVLAVQTPATVAAHTEAWPVPTHEQLNVQTDASAHAQSLDLFDVLGRSVRHAELRAGATSASLRCDGLPAGTYLLRVNYAEGVVARRIQVQ